MSKKLVLPRKRGMEQTTMSLDEFESYPISGKGRGVKPKSNRGPRKAFAQISLPTPGS